MAAGSTPCSCSGRSADNGQSPQLSTPPRWPSRQTSDLGPQLEAVIAASSELQERDALKRTSLAAAMAEALQQRGVPDPAASVAAELGVLAIKRAHARWANPANQQPFSELARQSLQELRAASAALS